MQEQRGYVRLVTEGQVIFSIQGKEDTPDKVSLNDLSVGGLRMTTDKKLNEQDILELTLQIPGIAGDLKAQGKTVWQRELTPESFDTGIAFTSMEAAVKEKLSNFIAGIAGKIEERREFVRYDLKTTVKYKLLDMPEVEKQCESIDVCSMGLKILLREKLEKGAKLCIAFQLPDEEEIVAECTVVAWSRKGDANIFETGIQFLKITEEDKNKISTYIRKNIKHNKPI